MCVRGKRDGLMWEDCIFGLRTSVELPYGVYTYTAYTGVATAFFRKFHAITSGQRVFPAENSRLNNSEEFNFPRGGIL